MLPESTFPVTGGIMQTEEVVPRAQSAGIDGSLTDSITFQHPVHRSPVPQCPLPSPVLMAVKQEPQEEDERARDTNSLSQLAEAESPTVSVLPTHPGHLLNGHETVHRLQVQSTEASTGPTNRDTTGRGASSRGRRKSRWKLKFHHQALPPEYLDHYEAALAQEALNASPTHVHESRVPSPTPTASTSTTTSTPSPVGDVNGWLQRIAAMQQEIYPRYASSKSSMEASTFTTPHRRSVITSTAHSYPGHHHGNHGHHQHHHQNHQNNHNSQQSSHQQTSTRPPMKYSDLPYMGEITLDNSKPRRGRKPKKADICHLIYKNYGTILPGTPGHEERKPQSPREAMDVPQDLIHHVPFQRTDIQNRISSLLEKRLTQESRRSHGMTVDGSREQDEPLNLCIRDLNHLKIRLHRKHGNVYESGQVKSETSSETDDVECVGSTFVNVPDVVRPHDLINNIANSNANNNNNNNNNNDVSVANNNTNGNVEASVNPGNAGFVYWPSTGVFIHPMALQSQLLYYQKMAENEKSALKSEIVSKEQKIVPKSLYSMLENKISTTNQNSGNPQQLQQQQQQHQQPATIQQPTSPRSKRNAPGGPQPQPTKRKRSAIFIPPMPTENNNNPATEVSICKFKFTGGAKPSLQEKKSLSVDAGGNFRYYSGTGDKNMRGYEFFPRETLQQPAGQSGSSAGAFLSAAGERIPPPVQCPRLTANNTDTEGRRKRKTRKSLQREKLEQTFKEKGFLIQTQQLESAEGATYCKFRQLRKFTRYLFRSWKDYLPGNVRELSGGGEAAAAAAGGLEADGETERAIVLESPEGISGIEDATKNVIEERRTLPLA